VSGLARKRVTADVPGLCEVIRGVSGAGVKASVSAPSRIRVRSRALASLGTVLLRGPGCAPRGASGCPLRPPFNGQLRTGTDRGNPTV